MGMANGETGKPILHGQDVNTTEAGQDELDGKTVKYGRHVSLLDYDYVDVCMEQPEDVGEEPAKEKRAASMASLRRSLSRHSQTMRNRVRLLSRDLSREGQELKRSLSHLVSSTWLHKFVISVPILSGTLPPLFIAISLAIASSHGTLFEKPGRNFVPYISDIGNFQPQSSVFTFGLSLSCLCTFLTIVIRYQQGVLLFSESNRVANKSALVIGCLLVIGKFLVASFQLSSSKVVHYLAAVLYVLCAVVYCWLQAYISYKNPKYHTKTRAYLRGCLVLGMTIGALIFCIFLLPPLHRFNRGSYSVAQTGEWLFAALKMAYFVGFFVDFMLVKPVFGLVPTVVTDTEDIDQGIRDGSQKDNEIQLTLDG